MEIASEMEVHVLHRNDLGMTAAGRAALHAEIRAERGFPDADDGPLADPVEAIAEADGRRRLALAGRRRIDRRHEDQLAVRLVRLGRDEFGRNLRLVVSVRQKLLGRYVELCADRLNRLLGRGARNFDVRWLAHVSSQGQASSHLDHFLGRANRPFPRFAVECTLRMHCSSVRHAHASATTGSQTKSAHSSSPVSPIRQGPRRNLCPIGGKT